MRISDWSSDVCSSDLALAKPGASPRFRLDFQKNPLLYYNVTLLVGSVERDLGCLRAVLKKTEKIGAVVLYARQVHFVKADERSDEHTSELQSLMRNSYAVFCFKKNHLTIIHTSKHT